jgi:DNA-binding NarL/FixJ family response regulator
MITRILLVDDQPLFREGIAGLLNSQADLSVVGAVGSVAEAIAAARTLEPDLILMDFSMRDGTGLDATRAILAERPSQAIVFLTVFGEDEQLFAAIRQGARGYVLKDIGVAELVSYVRASARGEPALSPALNLRILGEFAHSSRQHGVQPAHTLLTGRELDVFCALSTGATNDEIAEELVVSPATVKNHIHSILTKLNMHSRRDLILFARSLPMKH